MIIRDGAIEDIDECLVMSRKFYELTGYEKVIPFCEKTTRKYFNMGIGEMGSLFVAEEEGKLVGFIIGLFVPSMTNENYLVGTEFAWWVEPEYRKGTTGVKLLKHIEESAKKIGCVLWSMMCLEGYSPDRLEKLYLGMDYKAAERTFTKVLQERI